MGTPPLPEKVQHGEAGGQRAAMPPGVGKGGSGRPSPLTERGAGMLLTAREADGAFARGGWDPSCFSPLPRAPKEDMRLLVLSLPGHANPKKRCPRALKKEVARSVAGTLTCDRQPQQPSVSSFVCRAIKTDRHELTALLSGFFIVVFPMPFLIVSIAEKKQILLGCRSPGTESARSSCTTGTQSMSSPWATARSSSGKQPGAPQGPFFPPRTAVPFPQDPHKSPRAWC